MNNSDILTCENVTELPQRIMWRTIREPDTAEGIEKHN